MVTLEQIRGKVRRKSLYIGAGGSGKTHTALFEMLALVASGNAESGVIVDCEAGTVDEIEVLMSGDSEWGHGEYFCQLFESIEHRSVTSWGDYKTLALGGAGVVLIDTLNHKHVFARHYIKDKIVDIGYILVDDKKIPIEDPDGWTLDWKHYNQVYELETSFMEKLMHSGSHVLATLDMSMGKANKNKGEQNAVEGYFSMVVSTYAEGAGYRGVVKKNRGRRAGVDVLDPYYSVVKRYGDTELLKIIEKAMKSRE